MIIRNLIMYCSTLLEVQEALNNQLDNSLFQYCLYEAFFCIRKKGYQRDKSRYDRTCAVCSYVLSPLTT